MTNNYYVLKIDIQLLMHVLQLLLLLCTWTGWTVIIYRYMHITIVLNC